MTSMSKVWVVGILSAIAHLSALHAHDLWIEPQTKHSAPGDLIRVDLRLGHGAEQPESIPRNESRILRLDATGPSSKLDVAGLDGSRPAGIFRPNAEGTWILGYETTPLRHHLKAERFESYLVEEGLQHISLLRQQRQQTVTLGRELYSRSLKSLVQIGDGPLSDRQIGLPVELLLESIEAGEAVLRLLIDGQPRADARVAFGRLGEAGDRLEARTDDHGRVRFSVQSGRWVAATVHMVEEPSEAAEWRSIFATLSWTSP